ncbi:hypothetical protein KM043_013913 [Ampulex compressa]|nr:hypothetical protein KM043_013913 [Ampulex compressa]
MHGRVKVRSSIEQEQLKKKEQARKLKEYRACSQFVFQKRNDKIWDDELMQGTERMLLKNPDIYTLWNIRREAFEKNEWNKEEQEKLLQKELTLTENCLRENPKSYSVWHQRCWTMEHFQNPDWKRELALCAKCLSLDERNFHCWDYRQFVVGKADISDTEELDFSTSKIISNFSNYSSWHYRSRILAKMLFNDSQDLRQIVLGRKDELDFVMNATFTDPCDSSAWFYQRWLLDNVRAPCQLWRARVTQSSAKLIFTNYVATDKSVHLLIDDQEVEVQFTSLEGKRFAKLWMGTFSTSSQPYRIQLKFQGSFYSLESNSKGLWVYNGPATQMEQHYDLDQLREQLANYQLLLDMEPQNKWVLLTSIMLMSKIDASKFHENIIQNLDALLNADSLRTAYYKDLRSRFVLHKKLCEIWAKEDMEEEVTKIDLSGLYLSALHENHYLSLLESVNLDTNRLSNALHQLSTLQECKELSLSDNTLRSLQQFPTLRKLKVLSLRNNNLKDLEEIYQLIKRHDLDKLDLRDNPVVELCDAQTFVNLAPGLEFSWTVSTDPPSCSTGLQT